jgi:hypothetical protein
MMRPVTGSQIMGWIPRRPKQSCRFQEIDPYVAEAGNLL